MVARPSQASIRTAAAAALYVALVLGLLGSAWIALAALDERRAIVKAAETMLAHLEGRSPRSDQEGGPGFAGAPVGSPFLEGPAVTVAGAALLQRMAGAVSRAGGNVVSSQVELEKADAGDGWISLMMSCEIEQAMLQPLLYDLEAGMPFLFVDQLVVQAPVAGVEQQGRMRILLAVSGQWGGRK